MDTPSGSGSSTRRGQLLKLSAIAAVLALLGAVAALVVAPRVSEHLMTRQLDRLEDRTGLAVDVERVHTRGIRGVELEGIDLRADGDHSIGSIDRIEATVLMRQLLRGRPALSTIRVEGLELAIERREDGTTTFDDLRREHEASGGGTDSSPPSRSVDDELEAMTARALRHFGGRYPNVELRDIAVTFHDASDNAHWPVDRLSLSELSLAGGDSGTLTTRVDIDSGADSEFQLPESMAVDAHLRRPVGESTLEVVFDRRLAITDAPRLPFTEISLTGFSIDEAHTVVIDEPAIDYRLQHRPEGLASADRIEVRLDYWPRTADDLAIHTLDVDDPKLYVEYGKRGCSNLSELHAVALQPAAAGVVSTARSVGESMVSEPDADDEDQPPVPSTAIHRTVDRLGEFPVRDWLLDRVPRRTTVRNLLIEVVDPRRHEQMVRPASHIEFRTDIAELTHDPLGGLLEGTLQLETETDDHLGSADIAFEIPYRRGDWNASVDIDELQLGHLAQLAGPTATRYFHGGRLTTRLTVENESSDAESITRFEGLLVVGDLRTHLPPIADDPIEVNSASLHVDGYYDPTLALPEPKLLELDEDEQDETEQDDEQNEEPDGDDAVSIPDDGAFVVDEATARLADVEATIGVGLYGLDGFERPNRAAVDVELEATPLQNLVDAVPPALRGPLDGMELAGELAWDFALEVPLYEAQQMVWDADVRLSNDFEVVYLPEEVDVFKLTDQFQHTIEDEWEQPVDFRNRTFRYERTVTIPEMRPTPARWLLDNTSLSIEQIDRNRRRRQWPPVPASAPGASVQSPDYWLTSHADRDVADVPWDDDDTSDVGSLYWRGFGDDSDDDELLYEKPDDIPWEQNVVELDPERYGPYVYTPLHHISPYMVRAIKTTEDNSFFTHSGFNYLAIRQSVEQNLEAGRYVRGASTISMQLAKNLFLDRSRVLSRKLQEVVLVWLMESVADIPKSRMMELYLNIIEFGPGVFGIHEASMHYFGKRPDALTVEEVAWLVSIVPSPKRYHAHYERGEVSGYWLHRMSRYIRAMEARDRITEREKQRATDRQPAFYQPEDGEPILRADADPVDPRDDVGDEEVEPEEISVPQLD